MNRGIAQAAERHEKSEAIIGCLLGTAIGDAIGLPCEGLSRQRQLRFFPVLDGHRLLFSKGMISDDTEHTCFVAQSMIESAGEVEQFTRCLAWRLRWWLIGLPGGIGFATLRAILKLWLGYSPRHSGVFSAGNGPAMRSAILGVCCGNDPAKLRALIKASTRLTHTDPKAEYGALAVAVAAHFSAGKENVSPASYHAHLQSLLGTEAHEFLALISRATESVTRGESTETFASSLGLSKGVSGYVYHTVPVAIHAWLRNPRNYRSAVIEIIRCGGDADTTAAIAGGIVGAGTGKAGIPQNWLNGLSDWPRTKEWIESLGEQLSEILVTGKPQRAIRLPALKLALRNIFFITVIIAHGLRRLLPPY